MSNGNPASGREDRPAPRILVISNEFPPVQGGISRAMESIVHGLRQAGCRVKVVHRASRRLGQLACSVQLLFRCLVPLATLRPDVVLVGKWTMDGLPAFFINRLGGPPYAVMSHGTELLTLGTSSVRRRLARWVFGNARAHLVNSRFTAGILRSLLPPVPERPLLVFRSLLDLDAVARTAPGKLPPPIAALPDDAILMLAVARLVPRKGQLRAVGLLAELKDEWPSLHFAFTGTGFLRDEIKAVAEEQGIGDRVHGVGWVDESVLAALYRRAGIFLGLGQEEPDDVEGLGLAFIEAGEHGIPVVASRVGGVPEVIRDGQTGFLIDPEDGNAATARVRELLRDSQLRQRMGEAARIRVRQTFHVHDHTAGLLDVLLGNSPSHFDETARRNA